MSSADRANQLTFVGHRLRSQRQLRGHSHATIRVAIGGSMKRVLATGALIYLIALMAVITAQSAPKVKPLNGQQIFRFDTFGDEQLWTQTLLMQQAIASVSPKTALSVGLK